MGLSGARHLVDVAEPTVGLDRGGTTEVAKAYCEFIYPHDDPAWAWEASKSQYSCMLASMRWLEKAGAVGPGFTDPYKKHTGMIGPMMITAAKKWGAWHQCDNVKGLEAYLAASSPQPTFGQLIWIGLNKPDGKVDPAYGGSAHMLLVADQRGDAEMSSGERFDLLRCFEGGATSRIGYKIKEHYRRMVIKGPGNAWLQDLQEQNNGSFKVTDARRIYGVIDPYMGQLSSILDAAATVGLCRFTTTWSATFFGMVAHDRPVMP